MNSLSRWIVMCICAGLAGMLAGCASSSPTPQPSELPPNPGLFKMKQVWSAKLSEVNFPLQVRARGEVVAVAASDGTVLGLDARTGAEVWRVSLGNSLSAGVGFDGRLAAVVTTDNELVTIDSGRELWRQRMPVGSLTAPLIAGARVFVLGADRSVQAFDGQTGRRLWNQQRPGEPLVLRQTGVLLAVGDTLVAGLSGKLVGLHPLNGSVRWETPIASPRGTNDVERLVDLVAPVSRAGNVVCARAFQASVGCVDATRGTLQWTKPASGFLGVHGDAGAVLGVEGNDALVAWRRTDGERLWSQEGLRHRRLSAPLLMDRVVVVGDSSGMLHFISREDGSFMGRITTGNVALASAPVQVDQTLVVVTRNGDILGFRPE